MAVSATPVLKRELLTLLQARANLSAVLVTWGWPVGELPDEFLMLLDVDGSQTTKTKGQHRREEEAALRVWISVLRGRGEQQAATERAYALAEELETQLRETPTVNSSVRSARIEGRYALREAQARERCEASLTITVTFNKRII